jgi:hypothetical protein
MSSLEDVVVIGDLQFLECLLARMGEYDTIIGDCLFAYSTLEVET